MRSRVEIVARKSDHICVVRDVPDTRGNWYQRNQQQQRQQQQQQQRQDSSGGSIDQATPPAAATQAGGQAQVGSAGGPAAPGATIKPSFASLFGRHPAIKEEPTTPGGSLLSETPPPSSGGSKRSPLGLHISRSGPASGAGTEQLGQIITLINELKLDLKQDIAQLARRVDSIDSSVNKVKQTVSKLDKIQPDAIVCHQLDSPAPLALRVPGAGGGAPDEANGAGTDKGQRRERSKSPRRHHHHHHHHHRKASHSTPTATPAASQTDLSQQQATATSGVGASAGAAPPKAAKAEQQQQAGAKPADQPGARQTTMRRAPSSFEQSDDDQDATSKL